MIMSAINLYNRLIRQNRMIYGLASVLFMCALLYLGGREQAVHALPTPIENMDKVYHFMAFSFLASLTWFYFKGKQTWGVIAMVGLAGFIDEAHQALLTFRTADIMDWTTDVGAACFAVAVLTHLRSRFEPVLIQQS